MSEDLKASQGSQDRSVVDVGPPPHAIGEAGSDLYQRQIIKRGDDLMLRVWAGTPWMIDMFADGERDHRRMHEWCYARFGDQAFPFGDHPKPGRWRSGNATVLGWTWWGFSTADEMLAFREAWPQPATGDGVGRAPRPPLTASTGPGMPPNPSEVKP